MNGKSREGEKGARTWVWVLLGGGFFFIFMVAVITLMIVAMRSDRKFSGFGDKIAVVDLEGVIIEPQTVVGQLKDFGDDDYIKAIILHINTPRGGPVVSLEDDTYARHIRD